MKKYIGNFLVATVLTFLLHSLVYELPLTPTAQMIKHSVRAIPMSTTCIILWIIFSFPQAIGNILRMLGNSIVRISMFLAEGIGKVLEHFWQYNAGKIIITAGGLYLLYRCFY